MKGSVRLISSLALAASLAAFPAHAQNADAEESASQSGLDEIVVTAQRREESLQRAALAVTAITGDALVQKGVTEVTQLTSIAPSLQIATTYGPTPNFTLRGVGNFVVNVNSDPAIITNIDGVPIARPTGVHGLFYDLERIEVLKGPQGTLYGRNATGGAINVISRRPEMGEFSGDLSASYGNYDTVKLNGAVNLPVADSAALRLAGSYSRHDGYYSDGTGDEDLLSFRGTFRAEVSDSITLTFGADYTHMGGSGAGATVQGLPPFTGMEDPRSAAAFASTFSVPAGTFLVPMDQVPGARPQFQDNSLWGIYALAEIETPVGVLTIQPAYRKNRLDFLSSTPAFHALIDETNEQTSVEVRLVSDGGGPLDYILGAFYMKEENQSFVNFNQQFFAAYGEFSPGSKALAGYARLTYHVTPEFRITGAGRYTTDKRSSYQNVVTALVVCPSLLDPADGTPCIGTSVLPLQFDAPTAWQDPVNGGYLPIIPNGAGAIIQTVGGTPFSTAKRFNKFTWRAGVEYDVGPSSLLYATFETGFKAGGFYATPDPDPSFAPETVEAFTIGSKNRFLNNRLQLNLEAFWWTYKDRQFSHFVNIESIPGATTFGTDNVGKVRLRGLEVEAVAKATPTTTLDLTVQYLDAKQIGYTYTEPAGSPPPQTGCPVTGSLGTGFVVNCSGLRPQYAPEWTINGGIEQVLPLSNGADLKFSARGRYQSSQLIGNDYLPQEYEDGYFTADLAVTYDAPDQGYYLTAFVNNVGDKQAAAYSAFHPRGATLFLNSYIPPRTYGMRLGVHF